MFSLMDLLFLNNISIILLFYELTLRDHVIFGAGFPVELHWRVTSDPFLALTFPFDVMPTILGGTMKTIQLINYIKNYIKKKN